MSDRVAFLGYANGFPFWLSAPANESDPSLPWNTTPTAGDSVAPVGLSDVRLAVWWYRIKQFTLRLTANASTQDITLKRVRFKAPPDWTEFDEFGEPTGDWWIATRENELTQPWDGSEPNQFFSVNGPYGGPLPGFSYIQFSWYRKSTKQYWIDLIFQGNAGQSVFTIRPHSNFTPTDPYIKFTGTITIGEILFDWYCGSFFPVSNASVAVQSIEYWPFKGLDGLPICNTSTGEILPGRDPFNS